MPNIQLRVIKQGAYKHLAPYDEEAETAINNYGVNTILKAKVKKSRSPRFNSLAHVWAKDAQENIEDFQNLDAHETIKALQMLGNIACYRWYLPKIGETLLQAKTLAFDEMDETEFREVMRKIQDEAAKRYGFVSEVMV